MLIPTWIIHAQSVYYTDFVRTLWIHLLSAWHTKEWMEEAFILLLRKMEKKENKVIVGIDPDIKSSGICVINTGNDKMLVDCMPFPELISYLVNLQTKHNGSLVVAVEAGYLNDGQWHEGKNKRVQGQIGEYVGANHQTGKLIVEMCRYYGIETIEQPPLRKVWKKGKISQEEIAQFIPNWPKQSNQEKRDAALICWETAGYPIRLKSF